MKRKVESLMNDKKMLLERLEESQKNNLEMEKNLFSARIKIFEL
jgi:hypothetical protein